MAQNDERFINVRKLAALDMVFHGVRLILAEFMLSVLIGAAVGLFSLSDFLRSVSHPAFSAILGVAALGIALNYLPLVFYAMSIMRQHSAQREVAFELEHRDTAARKYTSQSLLLFVPFFVFALAVDQERQKRR